MQALLIIIPMIVIIVISVHFSVGLSPWDPYWKAGCKTCDCNAAYCKTCSGMYVCMCVCVCICVCVCVCVNIYFDIGV